MKPPQAQKIILKKGKGDGRNKYRPKFGLFWGFQKKGVVMKMASLILGIIGGIFGLFGALFAIFVGCAGAVFGVEDSSTLVGLGLAAIFLSILGIVGGSLAIAKPKPAGIMMLIAGSGGVIVISAGHIIAGPIFHDLLINEIVVIAISAGYIIAGPLLILAGIFCIGECR